MLRRFSTDFAVFSISLDAVLITLALAIAIYIRPLLSDLPMVADIPRPFQVPIVLYLFFPLTWILLLLYVSVYDGRRNLRFWKELANLTLGSTLAVTILAGALYLTYRDLSRVLFINFAVLAFGFLLVWRFAYRIAYSLGLFTGVQPRNVLIVGAGVLGQEVEKQISSYQSLGFRLVGFLDDDEEKRSTNCDILGPLDEASDLVQKKEVNDVVIAMPPRAYERVFSLITRLHTLPVRVWMIPDYFNLALYKTMIEEFAGLPMLDLRAPALTEYQRMTKRTFDLAITIISLPVTLLIMGIIALAIRIEGSGSVLFRQRRVGENGKLFEMLKFRTMILGAEEQRDRVEHLDLNGKFVHKMPGDPRVTNIGRALRRTSLDELPQLFNILKGEMSLVGPRPELPYMVRNYELWQYKRFAVPQGITGWWQVNGRSDKPMHLHTEDDLYYIQNYSIWLDLQILLKTFWVVVQGKGAF
jgi:exopolysaccharide biosynthesis polyprenyl glycosylphosphotransferase